MNVQVFYTVKDLFATCREAMGEGMGDARIFVYTGPDGVKVQAESLLDTDEKGGKFRILLSCESAVPQAGGPAKVGS